MTVLVTGGAGYIGAHIVRLLREGQEEVVVVDDLSTGDASRVSGVPMVQVDIAMPASVGRMAETMAATGTTSVIHLAARKEVGESVARPMWYYQQNVAGMANVLSAMELARVSRLVYSSSAAVYGAPDSGYVREDDVTRPENPYGETKLVGEWLIRNAARAWGLRGVSLRYFNVAGAGWPNLGDPTVANLVTMVLDRLSRGEPPEVFGTDYPTPDGSCIRDFVHVLDVAKAHVAALDYLDRLDRPFDVFNVGTGIGHSVLEVVRVLGRSTGSVGLPSLLGRRVGDPPRVVACVERIGAVLGWRAEAGLDRILASAWDAWRVREAGGRSPASQPSAVAQGTP